MTQEGCAVAKEQHTEALRWLGLWNLLLYAVGVVVTAILVILLVWSLIDERWAAAAAAGVGGLLELPLGLFLQKRRKEASASLREARKFVEKECGGGTAGGQEVSDQIADREKDFRLLGFL